jgi:hypothetical protein
MLLLLKVINHLSHAVILGYSILLLTIDMCWISGFNFSLLFFLKRNCSLLYAHYLDNVVSCEIEHIFHHTFLLTALVFTKGFDLSAVNWILFDSVFCG